MFWNFFVDMYKKLQLFKKCFEEIVTFVLFWQFLWEFTKK